MDSSSESASLLDRGASDEESPGSKDFDKGYPTWHTLVALCVVLFILEVSNYIAVAPQTAIFEDILCHRYYAPDDANGDKCKIEAIQSELALISGWRETFETIPALLVTIPYGALADRIGRKKVALIATLGCLLSDVWVRTVCMILQPMLEFLSLYVKADVPQRAGLVPHVLPLRFVWFSGAFQLIGGGATTLSSMLFVIAADSCTQEKRTKTFSHMTAAILLSELISVPLSAALMSINPWIPFLASSLILATGLLLIAVLIPETFHPDSKASSQSLMQQLESIFSATSTSPSLSSIFKDFLRQHTGTLGEIVRWIKHNVGAMLILSSFFVANIGRQSTGILLLYITRKFHWTFSKASFVISVRAAGNMIMLVFVLPILLEVLSRRSRLRGSVIEKHITQATTVMVIFGCILIFLAQSPVELTAGILLYAFGSAFTVTARSLLTALVEQKHLATVYTCLSVMTYSGMVTGGPLLASAYGWGMKMGDFWMGLPFLIAAGLFAASLFAVSMAKVH